MAICKVSSDRHFATNSHSAGSRVAESEAHWVPNTDVYVTDEGVVIKVEVAGMKKEDLELTVDGNRLRISGHREDGCRSAKCSFQMMEINYGAFESIVELPEGYDLGQARAAYQNGFLRVDVPVLVRATKRGITVTA